MQRCACGRTLIGFQERCTACFNPDPVVPVSRTPIDFANLFISPKPRRGKIPLYVLVGVPPPTLLDEAACGLDTAVLFDKETDAVTRAQQVCNGLPGKPSCPVREQCLLWALENEQTGSVWGGRLITPKLVREYRSTMQEAV